MAVDRNLDIALRIKAELNDARKQVTALEAALDKVGKEGKSADKDLRGTGKAVDKLGDTSRQTAGEVDRASGAIDKMGKKAKSSHAPLDRVSKDMHRVGLSAGEQRNAMRMLPAQMTDIVTGLISGQPAYMVAIQQGGQLRDSFGGVGGALKGIGQLITPTRLLIGGLTGSVALLAAALIKGYLNAQHLESALISTGNYAGTTGVQLQNLATSIAADNGGYADARKAMLLLAQSGKITHDALDDAARGAVAFAQLTGTSIEDAVAAVVSLQDKPIEAVRKLNQQYHFLEASTYDQIQALQEQGETVQAAALAQKAFADAMEERRNRDVQNLGAIQRAWKSVRDEMSKTWNLLLSFGSQSDQHQLDILYARRGAQQDRVNNPLGKILGYHDDAVAEVAAIDQQIAALKKKIAAEKDANEAESEHRQEQEKGIAALARINARTQQNATAAQHYADQIKAINADFDAAIKAMPKKADELNAQRSKQLRTLADSYAKSLTSVSANGSGGGGSGGNNNVSAGHATARAKAAASAQQQLIDTLQQLQAVQDPVASAWVKYWNVVNRATTAATKAKQATGANTAAIDAQLAAIKTLAAGTRDAAIDKIAQKDQRAWESLRDSLRTPTEVKIDTALAQIKKLNHFLKEGVITSEQYHQAITRVAQGSITQVPQYQGIDAAVGGVGSELAKNFRAQSALDAWHQQQLAANEAFRAQDTANEEAYRKRLNDIEAQYAKQSQVIQKSRNRLALAAAGDVFGQLATLSTSHNTKMARIGKAAAVAQAVINTYESATAAYASLASIPYVGPALGAAAAAAAIAAGMANVAQIRAQPVGGYATGGYTGDAPVTQAVGLVHGREGVLSAPEVQALGGEAGFNALRRAIKYGYADGGYVNPFANAPSPADLGITAPSMPRLPSLPVSDGGGSRGNKVGVRIINSVDPQFVTDNMDTPEGEDVILNTISRNQSRIKQMIG